MLHLLVDQLSAVCCIMGASHEVPAVQGIYKIWHCWWYCKNWPLCSTLLLRLIRVGSTGLQAALRSSEQGTRRSTLLFASCHEVLASLTDGEPPMGVQVALQDSQRYQSEKSMFEELQRRYAELQQQARQAGGC